MRKQFRGLWRWLAGQSSERRPSAALSLEGLEDRWLLSSGFQQIALVSDVPHLAARTDPNLINPWGFSETPDGRFRVSANGAGEAPLLTAQGRVVGPVVKLPSPLGSPPDAVTSPNGNVFNTTNDFVISDNGRSAPATEILSTEDGTIIGINTSLDRRQGVLAADQSATGAVYKLLALGSTDQGNFLYATNFHNNTIDVFDKNFHKVTLGTGAFGTFTDPNETPTFAPFGIKDINGTLFISYAKQKAPDNHDDQEGPGNGFVDEFDTTGHFIKRFASGTAAGGTLTELNSPIGMAVAPANYGPDGRFSGALLIGNFGDSHVSAFNMQTGDFLGQLSDEDGQPLILNGGFQSPDNKGLWGIGFGNGHNGANPNTLFFAAGINDENDGVFGKVQFVRDRHDHDRGDSPFRNDVLDATFALLSRSVGNHAILGQTSSLKDSAAPGQLAATGDATGTVLVQQSEHQPLRHAREALPAAVDGVFGDLLGNLL